jgi:hypothetical protein
MQRRRGGSRPVGPAWFQVGERIGRGDDRADASGCRFTIVMGGPGIWSTLDRALG